MRDDMEDLDNLHKSSYFLRNIRYFIPSITLVYLIIYWYNLQLIHFSDKFYPRNIHKLFILPYQQKSYYL